jgi:hypothetical protein
MNFHRLWMFYFYRLHRSCRSAAFARMRQGAGVADIVGWPAKVRDGLWQVGDESEAHL